MAKLALLDQWANGAFQSSTVEETALANSNALGAVNELNRLLEIDEKVINEVISGE